MKRCPQCEFIYEDDQSLCDMDGVLLVFDSRTLPHLHALTTVPPKPQPRRNKAVPAFATLILALVLGMVYYVSIHRRAAQNTYTPAPPSAASTSSPLPVGYPTPEVQPSAEEPKSPTTKPAAVVPPPKKPAAAKTLVAVQTKPEPKRDDSKVGSFLKKTGRVLKKPFKF